MSTKTKFARKTISILLAVFMILGTAFVGAVNVSAASSTIKVRIANVRKLYSDAKSLLDMVNSFREDNGSDPLKMDKNYLDKAMLRACELSLYASATTPSGEYGSSYASDSDDRTEVFCIDMPSVSYAFSEMKRNSEYDLLYGKYRSAGVGVVSVNGRKFFSLLLSDKAPLEAPASAYQQSGAEAPQEVETLLENISDIRPAYGEGQGVYCGSSIYAYVLVRNKLYNKQSVYLEPYNATVSLSDEDVFEYRDKKVYAKAPGSCTMLISFSSNILAKVGLKAVGKQFSECRFSEISDQVYTGKPITPSPEIIRYDSTTLVKGIDYNITYENNVNIGVGIVHIEGKGEYAGEKRDIRFNIISSGSSPDTYFGTSLVLSKTTIPYGESVSVSAISTGGMNPVKYSFYYAPEGTAEWKSIVENTTQNSCNFKPSSVKKYYIRVNAVDNGGRKASKTLTITVTDPISAKLTVSAETVYIGNKVYLTANSTGGNAPVQYSFSVMKPGKSSYEVVREYSAETKAVYTPASEGIYQFRLTAKSHTGETSSVTKIVTVKRYIIVNKSSVSRREIDAGQSLTLYGLAVNGKAPYSYAYLYKKSDSNKYITIKSFSASNKITYKPRSAGNYTFCIKIKDSSGNVSRKFFNVKVYSALVNNSKVSAAKTLPGKSIVITGAASGGKPGYQYAYFYKPAKGTSFNIIKNFSSSAKTNFVLYNRGTYTVRVNIKDQNGNIAKKDLEVTFASTMTNECVVSSVKVKSPGTVTIKFAAKGGKAPYKYTVSYRAPGSKTYSSEPAFSSMTKKTYKVSRKGTWVFRIKVRDSSGAVIAKSVAVKVT